jgi:hypothetical protein
VWEQICVLPPTQLHPHSLSCPSRPIPFPYNTFELQCQRFHPHRLSFRMRTANRNGITHHPCFKNNSTLRHLSTAIRNLYWYRTFIPCPASSFKRAFPAATYHLLLRRVAICTCALHGLSSDHYLRVAANTGNLLVRYRDEVAGHAKLHKELDLLSQPRRISREENTLHSRWFIIRYYSPTHCSTFRCCLTPVVQDGE